MIRIALLALALLIAGYSKGHAQQPMACAPAGDLFAKIKKQYGEVPIFHGTTSDGQLVTVTANFDTGTWTVLIEVTQQGTALACVASAGDGATVLAPPKPGAPM